MNSAIPLCILLFDLPTNAVSWLILKYKISFSKFSCVLFCSTHGQRLNTALAYKSFYEPPMEIKRKLNRLAATLEILDEEFENIRYDISLYNQSLDKEEKVLKTDINKDSLIAYVK